MTSKDERFDKMMQDIVQRLPPFEKATDEISAAEAKVIVRQEGRSLAEAREKQAIDHLEIEMAQKSRYAARVFWFVVFWICAVLILLLLQGFGAKIGYAGFSDKVLITLIGTTTVNIIATLILVLRYLFRTSGGRL